MSCLSAVPDRPGSSAASVATYASPCRAAESARTREPADGPLIELDRRLVGLCRERGALRSVLARIAARLFSARAWERIGYARLSDYSGECLGLAGRSVRSLAEVGARFRDRPGLEQALVAGTLGWTKVRLLARLPLTEDEALWIDHARRVTAEELSRAVRAVDRGSIEAGAAEEEDARSRLFEVRCTREVRWKWRGARGAAARVAGRALHISEAAELIAAEVLSALPIEEEAEGEACHEAGVSWRQGADSSRDTEESARCARLDPPWRAHRAVGTRQDSAGPAEPLATLQVAPQQVVAPKMARGHGVPLLPAPALPRELELLLENLEEQDAFGLDERFRSALQRAQCLDARIGALLAQAWSRFLHRALGYPSREAYARERLGMDPTRARALVRLERAARASVPFARAYRMGALTWLKAAELVPLVNSDPLGRFMEDWVAWADRITLRRLREDVERAVALAETDHVAFRRGGGLPPEAGSDADEDREIGATAMGPNEHTSGIDEGAFYTRHPEPLKSAPDEVCWARFIGPPDIVHLFRAVLCTVRRHAGLHVLRKPPRPPHPLPLRGRRRRARQPHHALRVPPPARHPRGAAALCGAGP